jgi:(4S)-4-hydroxy-5-phosphonooxypentane-2,3-dione isomerase
MSIESAEGRTRWGWRLAAALSLVAAGFWTLVWAPRAVATEPPAEVADGSPICVAVIYVVQPGREEEATEDLRRLAAVTRKEPGNLLYAVHRSLDDPRQFMIYEQYRSPADLDAHRKAPYYQRYAVEGLQKIAESRTGGTFTPF